VTNAPRLPEDTPPPSAEAPLGAIRAGLFHAGRLGRCPNWPAIIFCRPRLSTASQRPKVAMMMVQAAKLAIRYCYDYRQRGTHIRNTAEIGPVTIGKIENKGRQNRRINIAFAE
jgi:Threonyl and Alanyl tRNA synthetase second additional domain